MVFSSLIFTFIFLPIALITYYFVKKEYRNYILLIASLIFYAYGEPRFVFIMLLSIVVNYIIAIIIEKSDELQVRKCFLITGVVLNLMILYFFKYFDFTIKVINKILNRQYTLWGIALPIGISFFTFQALSYVIDVYRKEVKAQKNIFYLALYIALFPQLIAGPIVRYSTIEEQIVGRTVSFEDFSVGARRFVYGFCKKVLLANNLAIVAENGFGLDEVSGANSLYLWLAAICFSLQIYYDFSGYSDMAIGLGRMFGFHFDENFNYPYMSRSVTEFWRRWHISLGTWFRDYVYIPLGGSRVGPFHHFINIFVVWLLTGIWHGANFTFIAWGLWYFLLLVLEKYIVKPEKRSSIWLRNIWRVITLLCVIFGWVLFNSDGVGIGVQYCLAMLGITGDGFHLDAYLLSSLREYGFFVFAGIVFAAPIADILQKKIMGKRILQSVYAVLEPILSMLLFLWAISFLVLGAHNPFIYFNF